MPIIRKVFGPFSGETFLDAGKHKARWYFIGIRDDYATAHWVLIFDPSTRQFRASSIPVGEGLGGRVMRKVEASLPKAGRDESANPKMWLNGDEPVMEGKVSDILKSKLKPEDIAKATALAIIKR